MTANTNNDWYSLHLFMPMTNTSQQWIAAQLMPQLQQWQQQQWYRQWFFIRYWHGGPHLRVRLFDVPANRRAQIKIKLAQLLAVLRSEPAISRQQYYQNHTFDGVAEDIQALPWFDHCTVHDIAYEPEYLRYGGRLSINISEQLFCASTQWVVSQLTRPDWQQMRLTIAWHNMVFTARQLLSDDTSLAAASQFFQQYAQYWRSHALAATQIDQQVTAWVRRHHDQLSLQLQQCWHQQQPTTTTALADANWQTALQQCRVAWLADASSGALQMPYGGFSINASQRGMALQALTASHLHMTNNRLGIAPAEEYQLALLISAIVGEAQLCNPV